MSLPAVVPAPSSIEARPGEPFDLDARVAISGDPDAAAVLVALIRARTGLDASTSSATGGGSDSATGAETGSATGGGSDSATGGIALRVVPGTPESYTIDVGAAGIVIAGADTAGLFYGVQTLGQLIVNTGEGWAVPPVAIVDAPRFAYRGVMLDVARHFHPVDTVRGYIDRAAGLKFNALHLHLTDDQGWRVQLDSRPLLTARGSGSSVGGDPGGFYSKDDYRAIVAYAASRHMILVPEIDMPGHTHAVGLAYPELAAAPVLDEHILEVVRDHGGKPPAAGAPYDGMAVGFSSLRIDTEATYDFVADVFGELAAMTPGPYLHLGGDEAFGTDPADFAAFVERASEIIADLGKTPVAWHEAGAASGLHDSTIGQYWGFVEPTDGMDDKARAFVRNGSRLILSPADAVYLDMKPTPDAALGLTWANGATSVERAYRWEPSDVIAGIADDDILGVEAPMWTETIRDADDLDRMAFPRIAAAAEAAWSPPTGTDDRRTWPSFRTRVGALAPLWTSLGIAFDRSAEIAWVEAP
ncbi:beta-N-acetylhexosaminidase [Planococcus sp. APC 4015]|nr:beta-N-acetylhexosaminidase [Planococcus sp. APC 4015]